VATPSSYRPAPGSIPTKPGVYRFRDAEGPRHLRRQGQEPAARLSSYFQDIGNLHPRTATMVTTAPASSGPSSKTEVEALQLEYSWIKEFDPRFNVKYRDDKSYPWLAVTVGEEFPAGDGRPRRQAQGHPLLRPLQPRLGDPRDRRPAAARLPDALVQPTASSSGSAQIGRPACSATSTSARRPCVGNVSAEEHRAIVDDFCDFMAGQTKPFREAG
jgi:excinuclease ABC subunit C